MDRPKELQPTGLARTGPKLRASTVSFANTNVLLALQQLQENRF
jgi:hypothetical protein